MKYPVMASVFISASAVGGVFDEAQVRMRLGCHALVNTGAHQADDSEAAEVPKGNYEGVVARSAEAQVLHSPDDGVAAHVYGSVSGFANTLSFQLVALTYGSSPKHAAATAAAAVDAEIEAFFSLQEQGIVSHIHCYGDSEFRRVGAEQHYLPEATTRLRCSTVRTGCCLTFQIPAISTGGPTTPRTSMFCSSPATTASCCAPGWS